MRSLLMSFKAHCDGLGLELLREDWLFIREQIARVPVQYQKQVLGKYARLWAQMLGELGDVVQAQNVGRRTANGWLLDVVSKQ